MRELIKLFLPLEEILDGDDRRIAGLLVAAALLLLPLTLWLTFSHAEAFGLRHHRALGPAAVSVGLIATLLLCRAGFLRLGGAIALSGGFAMAVMSVAIEGPHTIRSGLFPIIIITAALLVRPWVAVAFSAGAVTCYLVVDQLAATGALGPFAGPADILSPIRLVLVAGLVGWLLGRGFQATVRQLRSRQHELAAGNAALADSQARARASKARYAELVLQSPDGIARVDEAGHIEQPNPALCDMLGYTREQLEGLTLEEAGLPAWPFADDEGTNGGAREHLLERAPQRGAWVEVLVRRMAQTGNEYRAQLIVHDIDARKRAKQLEDELFQSQKMESIGRLAGGVAHDFNNILTVISGNAHLLGRRIDDPAIDDILQAVDRAERITRQLLAFGRRRPAGIQSVDLNAAIAAMRPMLAPLIGANVSIQLDLAAEPGWVEADPTFVDQVILNLVVNAQEAMPAGGGLFISTSREVPPDGASPTEMVRLRVRDTGAGMSPEVAKHIFEPFFSTKGMAEGAGLGLATVHGIVAQLGGRIGVESELGNGTTFDIWLNTALAEESIRRPSTDLADLPAGTPETATILLVDDEIVIARTFARALRAAGHVVLLAADGDEAIAAVRAHHSPVDVLVTDVVLAKGTGPEVAARLRAEQPNAKVLYMSGYPAGVLEEHDVSTDAAFLPKPFSLDELEMRVRLLLAPG